MKTLLTNANTFIDGRFKRLSLVIENGSIVDILKPSQTVLADEVLDLNQKYLFPGFVDVHVHLREPGFFYKESIKTGTAAAAAGGYTAVCSMPNLNPVPDCIKNLQIQTDIINKDAVIAVYPYASITKGENGEELVDFDELSNSIIAFSDDGKGVQNEDIMLTAMQNAKRLNKVICAHAEDNSLLNGGYIHDGEYAKKHGHKGISSASEYKQVERDICLAEKTGVKYHVCHVSTKESVELIRKARARGIDVTCETAPHYLTLTDDDLIEDGRFKMNPPLREKEDRAALIEGIKDGTVTMIATDHAPHSFEEKSKGLSGSLMGITGLETSFPILYTKLVKKGIISLEKLVSLMSELPAQRFGIKSGIKIGNAANLTVFDLDKQFIVNPEEFKSKGKSTPFSGEKVYGKCLLTVYNGKAVYDIKNN